jgi:hypothetical protein
MVVKLQDFIGGRINPSVNPKHKVVSEFLTFNNHKNHGFDEKTAFIVEAVYEKIMALRGGFSSRVGVEVASSSELVQNKSGDEIVTFQRPSTSATADALDPIELGNLIKKSEATEIDQAKLSSSGKSALSSMTSKW